MDERTVPCAPARSLNNSKLVGIARLFHFVREEFVLIKSVYIRNATALHVIARETTNVKVRLLGESVLFRPGQVATGTAIEVFLCTASA